MTTTETETEMHSAELAAAKSQAARVRYARRTLGPEASAPQVRDWLAERGYKVGKSTLYDNMTAASATDTAELPRLTGEQLAELGAALSAPAAPEAPAEAAEVPVAAPADPAPAEAPTDAPEAAPAALAPSETDPAAEVPEPGPAAEGPALPEARPDSVPESAPAGPVAGPAVRTEPESEGPESGPSPVRSESGPAGVRSGSGIPGPVRVRESGPGSESPAEATGPESGARSRLVVWPVMLMALAAFVTIWSGWVGLGEMTGFGMVQPFPGISKFELNTAITLPVGVEAYASYALYVWLSGRASATTARFARVSAFGALTLGAAGQIAYHLLTQAQADDLQKRQAVADAAARAAGRAAEVVHASAPWWITTFVACLPVIVVGMGAALAHMVIRDRD